MSMTDTLHNKNSYIHPDNEDSINGENILQKNPLELLARTCDNISRGILTSSGNGKLRENSTLFTMPSQLRRYEDSLLQQSQQTAQQPLSHASSSKTSTSGRNSHLNSMSLSSALDNISAVVEGIIHPTSNSILSERASNTARSINLNGNSAQSETVNCISNSRNSGQRHTQNGTYQSSHSAMTSPNNSYQTSTGATKHSSNANISSYDNFMSPLMKLKNVTEAALNYPSGNAMSIGNCAVSPIASSRSPQQSAGNSSFTNLTASPAVSNLNLLNSQGLQGFPPANSSASLDYLSLLKATSLLLQNPSVPAAEIPPSSDSQQAFLSSLSGLSQGQLQPYLPWGNTMSSRIPPIQDMLNLSNLLPSLYGQKATSPILASSTIPSIPPFFNTSSSNVLLDHVAYLQALQLHLSTAAALLNYSQPNSHNGGPTVMESLSNPLSAFTAPGQGFNSSVTNGNSLAEPLFTTLLQQNIQQKQKQMPNSSLNQTCGIDQLQKRLSSSIESHNQRSTQSPLEVSDPPASQVRYSMDAPLIVATESQNSNQHYLSSSRVNSPQSGGRNHSISNTQKSNEENTNYGPNAPVPEYCMYCGKHCPTNLLQHMQLHFTISTASSIASASSCPSFSRQPPNLHEKTRKNSSEGSREGVCSQHSSPRSSISDGVSNLQDVKDNSSPPLLTSVMYHSNSSHKDIHGKMKASKTKRSTVGGGKSNYYRPYPNNIKPDPTSP